MTQDVKLIEGDFTIKTLRDELESMVSDEMWNKPVYGAIVIYCTPDKKFNHKYVGEYCDLITMIEWTKFEIQASYRDRDYRPPLGV
jgi:hypothetical protein